MPNSGGCRVLLRSTTAALFSMVRRRFGQIRFRCHKGDQVQTGNVLVRTRKDVRGVGSSLREGSGAVTLHVKRFAVHINLPSVAPLASYRKLKQVAV